MSALEGRAAIVSGAAQGLGLAYAEALASNGVRVLGFDVRDQVMDLGVSNVQGMVADVATREGVERVVAAAESTLGGVDILVNNAGAWKRTPVDSAWEQTVADWDEIMDTNVLGVLMLSRACVPIMQRRGGGDIVNISTYYVLPARSPGTNGVETDLYNASKWALNGFTDAWAKYLHKDNIRVNGICMGATDTAMLRGLFTDGELPAELAATVMQPDDMGRLLIDLLEDGRSGENIGAWVGHAIELGPVKEPHRRITG